MALPINHSIIDELKKKKTNYRFEIIGLMFVIFVFFVFFHSFLWLSFKTYCDQSQNRQDVVEGIPENSPPGQYHHLRRYKSVGFTGSSVLSQISPQWVFNSFVRLNQIIMTKELKNTFTYTDIYINIYIFTSIQSV